MPTRRTRRNGKGASAKGASKPFTVKSKGFDPNDDGIEEMLPKGLARAFVQSQLKSAERQLQAHGLSAPVDYEGDMPELPDDIDAVDHAELSNLLLAFQNALATAIWQQSNHYVMSNTFDEISEYMEAVALHDAEGSNAEQRKGAARTNEQVVFFRARHVEHYNSYVRFRDLAKTIDGKVKAISRVGGFAQVEIEASDMTAQREQRQAKRRARSSRS